MGLLLATIYNLETGQRKATKVEASQFGEERIYWIETPGPGRLAIMARPRAGEWLADAIQSWRTQGLTTIVSLLEDHEIADLGLQDELRICAEVGLEFVRFPIPDRGLPASLMDSGRLARELSDRVEGGGAVGIHCRAGIGRSAIVAAHVLTVLSVPNPLALISQARGTPTPDTDEQREWVGSLSGLLGLVGTLDWDPTYDYKADRSR